MSVNNCRPVKLLSHADGEVYGIWTTVQWKPFDVIAVQLRAVGLQDAADHLNKALTAERGYDAAAVRLYASGLAAIHDLSAHSEWNPTDIVEHISTVGIRLFTGANWNVRGSQTVNVNTNLSEPGHYVRLVVQNDRVVGMTRMCDSQRVPEILLEKGHDLLPYIYPRDLEQWQ